MSVVSVSQAKCMASHEHSLARIDQRSLVRTAPMEIAKSGR